MRAEAEDWEDLGIAAATPYQHFGRAALPRILDLFRNIQPVFRMNKSDD